MRPHVSPVVFKRVAFGTLVALIAIVITGAAVRLTGSGLGCPDWPNCTKGSIVAPLSFHPLIEYGNRLFTAVVGIAVVVNMLAAIARKPHRRDLTVLSLALVLGVVAEAVLGGISVKHRLDPKYVMAHFLLSMLIVWAAVVLNKRAGEPSSSPRAIVHRDYVLLVRGIFLMTCAVLFAGTMVTGSGPHAGADNVVRLGFKPHDITRVHGALVWLLLLLVVLTLWRLNAAHASSTLIHKGEFVVMALLAQGAIGYLQYALGVPAGLVIFHIAGALTVWISVISFNLALYERWEPTELAAYDGASEVKEEKPPSETSLTS